MHTVVRSFRPHGCARGRGMAHLVLSGLAFEDLPGGLNSLLMAILLFSSVGRFCTSDFASSIRLMTLESKHARESSTVKDSTSGWL